MTTDTIDYFAHPEKQPLPYIEFEMMSQESRDTAGQAEYKDVAFVKITQPGGKDTVVKLFSDWLKTMQSNADAGRIPPHWVPGIKQAHEAWLKGEELPTDGYALKLWTPLTRAQLKLLLDIKLRTVEDLAAANESTIDRIGMGGRALVTMAQDWIKERSGPGALASKLADLEKRLDSATELVKRQEAVIAQLMVFVPDDKKPKTPERPTGVLHVMEESAEE